MYTVKHRTIGFGKVTSVNDSIIEVDFSGDIKKFQFPKAFENFLTTDDEELLLLIEKKKAEVAKKAVVKPLVTTPSREGVGTKRVYTMPYEGNVSSPLVGDRAQTIPVRSMDEMFELVGYMARPGRISSIEAEVPKDGRDKTFERMFPGQTYRPIEMGDTPSGLPNKLSPQFRINFGDLRNCPDVLRKNMGKGNGSCVGRINKSKFVIDIVQNYGFRFGSYQNVDEIKEIARKKCFTEAFERGYNR